MRKARAISAQSTGTTSRRGLAFHIWSTVRSVGSCDRLVCSCSTPPAIRLEAGLLVVISHHVLPRSAGARAEADIWSIHEAHRLSITSGPGTSGLMGAPALSMSLPGIGSSAFLGLLLSGDLCLT